MDALNFCGDDYIFLTTLSVLADYSVVDASQILKHTQKVSKELANGAILIRKLEALIGYSYLSLCDKTRCHSIYCLGEITSTVTLLPLQYFFVMQQQQLFKNKKKKQNWFCKQVKSFKKNVAKLTLMKLLLTFFWEKNSGRKWLSLAEKKGFKGLIIILY